MKFKALVELA